MADLRKDALPRAAIDWTAIHARLEEVRERASRGLTTSPERAREILSERARRAARTPVSAAGEMVDVVEFRLGDERFAFELGYVREVVPLRGAAVVPGAPPFVHGVINLRGKIIAVLDLRQFFGISAVSPEAGGKVIILNDGTVDRFGILAEEVTGIASLATATLDKPPPSFTGIRAALTRGITGDRLALLNAKSLLTEEELKVAVKNGME